MRRCPVPLLPAAILAMIAPSAAAVTLHVPGDHPTIQAALAAASPGDVVEVACGEYFEANLNMPSGVVLRSATGDADCVTVNADGQERCIWVDMADASTQIEGLELVGAGGSGGGIYCFDSSRPEIRACRFARNLTGGDGAGLVAAAGSAPHVVDCEFVDNRAIQGSSDLERGGAIWSNYSQPVFEDCVVRRNGARIGGGAFAMNSEMTFIRCTLVDDYTPLQLGEHGMGGGAYGENTSWSFTDCRFVRNRAGLYGGASYLVGPGQVLMDRCTLVENSAFLGEGALALLAIEGDFVSCLFPRNEAITGRAGALVVSATSSVIGCTFFGNRSPQDGSSIVWASPDLTTTHTIIAGGRGGAGVYCLPRTFSRSRAATSSETRAAIGWTGWRIS